MPSFNRIVRKRYWQQRRRCIWCGELTWCRTVMRARDAAKEFGIAMGERGSRKALRHRMATAEHIWPKSLGGTNGVANIVMACQLCNSRRSRNSAAFPPNQEVLTFLPKEIQGKVRRYAT